ncbi:unnamed protein product [Schistosoma mattheei]|uniref:Uncharacterized protein n=1 Tax=Schistosoma mattheei TaxID=31246 RepID=A0A183P5J0_9TREM|nr:unnamed protein product [Schistosoma mattheei]
MPVNVAERRRTVGVDETIVWTLSERGFVAVRQLPGIKILPEFKSTLRVHPLSSVNDDDDDTDATAPDDIT